MKSRVRNTVLGEIEQRGVACCQKVADGDELLHKAERVRITSRINPFAGGL